jgi:diadenosine tetraphosphatase ApaH/serine/threonine PP2A family protein phosphatase
VHAFDLLPCVALIDGDVLSVHGGLSQEISLLEEINLNNGTRILTDLARGVKYLDEGSRARIYFWEGTG